MLFVEVFFANFSNKRFIFNKYSKTMCFYSEVIRGNYFEITKSYQEATLLNKSSRFTTKLYPQ